MIETIYKKSLDVLLKKPFRLWGISLLCGIIIFLLNILFGLSIGISIAISLALDASMTLIYLRGYRGEEICNEQLFDSLKDAKIAKRVICGMAWKILWVFIWLLIPIIGIFFAIKKAYAYRLTPYILMQEPDISIMDAIKVSEQRTNGFKLKMFIADFLIFITICAIVFILALISLIPLIGILSYIVLSIFMLGVSLLLPLFLGLIKAAFYEEIMHGTIIIQ